MLSRMTSKKKISEKGREASRRNVKLALAARWKKAPTPAADLARQLGISRQAAWQRLRRKNGEL